MSLALPLQIQGWAKWLGLNYGGFHVKADLNINGMQGLPNVEVTASVVLLQHIFILCQQVISYDALNPPQSGMYGLDSLVTQRSSVRVTNPCNDERNKL